MSKSWKTNTQSQSWPAPALTEKRIKNTAGLANWLIFGGNSDIEYPSHHTHTPPPPRHDKKSRSTTAPDTEQEQKK